MSSGPSGLKLKRGKVQGSRTTILMLSRGALLLAGTSRAQARPPVVEQLAKTYGLNSFWTTGCGPVANQQRACQRERRSCLQQRVFSLINLGYEALDRHLRTLVLARLTQWQFNFHRNHVMVRDLLQEMSDTIEPCAFLTVGVNHIPWALLCVGVSEHYVLSTRIVHPMVARFNIHRAQLPALDRVSYTLLESFLLFFIVHRKPVFDQNHAGTDEHLLE